MKRFLPLLAKRLRRGVCATKSGNPLLAKRMRRGGCAIRIDPHSFVGADGVVSLSLIPKGNHPVRGLKGCCAAFT